MKLKGHFLKQNGGTSLVIGKSWEGRAPNVPGIGFSNVVLFFVRSSKDDQPRF